MNLMKKQFKFIFKLLKKANTIILSKSNTTIRVIILNKHIDILNICNKIINKKKSK